MKLSDCRLLVNAEPFGFGPSSSLFDAFEILKKEVKEIAFIGSGLALDFNKNLSFDRIHNIEGLKEDEIIEYIHEIKEQYDMFFTFMDFWLLELVKEAGMICGGYDSLTFYRRKIRKGITISDLYIAQDFFGVRERIARNSHLFPSRIEVCGLFTPIELQNQEHLLDENCKPGILINLGGLQNRHWSFEDTLRYAENMISAVTQLFPQKKITVITSKRISESLSCDSLSPGREEAIKLLANCEYAFMVPGLFNIIHANMLNSNCVWLPPHNGSGGIQMQICSQNQVMSNEVFWTDIEGNCGEPDYQKSNKVVLNKININLASIKISNLSDAFRKNMINNQNCKVDLEDNFSFKGQMEASLSIFKFIENI